MQKNYQDRRKTRAVFLILRYENGSKLKVAELLQHNC